MRRRARSMRPVLFVAAAVLFGFLLFRLRAVLSPIFFAFLLAYMLDPLVDRLEALRIPRAVGIVLLLTIVLSGMAVFALTSLPVIVRDVMELGQQLPVATSQLIAFVRPVLSRVGLDLSASASDFFYGFGGGLARTSSVSGAPAQVLLSTILGGTASFLGGLVGAVMVPVFAFYLLEDFDRIVARARDLLPIQSRPRVESVAREVDRVLGQFLRGQVIVMALLAVLYAAGYALVGVTLAVPIGVIAGLLSFIPYVGGAAALGMALLMTIMHYQGAGQLLAVGAVYAAIQLLEGFYITPRIVGDKLGLAPVWVLFALMAGGELFGFMGVLLALPLAAIVKVFVVRGVERYTASSLFLGDAAARPGRLSRPPPPVRRLGRRRRQPRPPRP